LASLTAALAAVGPVGARREIYPVRLGNGSVRGIVVLEMSIANPVPAGQLRARWVVVVVVMVVADLPF
jgi:hypothetical protein